MILRCDRARFACGLLVGLLALAPYSGASDVPEGALLVRLKSTAPFDPLQRIPDVSRSVPKAQSLQKTAPVPAFVVQFSGPMTAARQSAVAALGFKVLDYVPANALVVRGQAESSLERLRGLDDVRAVFELTPGFKLSSELTGLPEPSAPTVKTFTIDVSMFTGSQPESFVKSVLAAFPGVSLVWTKKSDPPAARFDVPAKSLGPVVGALAIHGDVEFLDLVHERERENDNSVWIHQSYGSNGPAEASDPDPKSYPTTATIWQKGLLGQGQIVGVTDTPFDITMQQFDDPSYPDVTVQTVVASDAAHAIQPNPNHRKIWAINAPGGVYPLAPGPIPPDDCVRHGTHTSGSIAGDCRINLPSLVATPSCPNPPCFGHDTGDGMAPLAKLLLELGEPGNGGTVSDLLSQQWVAGARLSSFSWTMSTDDIDYAVWRHPDLTVFAAAGNRTGVGTIGSNNKNAIVVGMSKSYGSGFSPEDMDYRSSQGPTSDGRIKPDIVATGSPVWSSEYPVLTITDPAQCDPNAPNYCKPRSSGGCFVWDITTPCGTWPESGTSMATPTAAGLGALARQYFTDGFYPTGVAVGGNSVVPSAALLKAVLINGARNMVGVAQSTPLDDAPSFFQGWGRLELDDALYFSGETRKLWLKDVANSGGLQTFDRTLYNVQVTGASAAPLKITLAWTDAPNASLGDSSLVDDLDLIVTGPDGTIYRGNQWDDTSAHGDKRSHPYAAGTACPDPNNPSAPCRDGINNVEGILIPVPSSGLYRVRLDGRNVPGYVPDGVTSQGYALVVTGEATSMAGDACTPGPAPQGLTASLAHWNDVVLNWQGVPGAVSYQIRRSTMSCTATPNFVQDVTTNGPIHVQTAANTHYYFTVRADVGAAGCQTSSSSCVEVTTPAAPAVAGSTPAFIPNTDQAVLAITGSNLTSAQVYLGTTAQPQKYELTQISASSTQILARLPGNEQSAAYNVRIVFPSYFPDVATLNNAVSITAPLQVSTIFTSNYGPGGIGQNGSLSAINLSTMALMETRDLGANNNPVDVTIRKQRDLGLMTFYLNTVRAFVPETRTILRTLSTVPDTPNKVAFDPSGNTAYVLSSGYPLTLRKLDMNTFTFTGSRLNLGDWGNGEMKVSSDGSQIYVSSFSDPGYVFIVRASDMSLVAKIPVGRGPVGMALSSDGTRLYVANLDDASVSVINFASLNYQVSTIDVSDGGPGPNFPYSVAVSGGNSLLHVSYASESRANFDPATGQNLVRDTTSQPQWFGLEYLPSTSKLYAIAAYPPAVMRWNKDTLAIETSTTVGEGVFGISIAEIIPLTITSVSPVVGCSSGGTEVKIRGSGFQGEVRDDNNNVIQNRTRVFFGGTESTSVTLVDSTSILAIAPPHKVSIATVPVLVSNPNGSSATLSGVFRYQKCLEQSSGTAE